MPGAQAQAMQTNMRVDHWDSWRRDQWPGLDFDIREEGDRHNERELGTAKQEVLLPSSLFP